MMEMQELKIFVGALREKGFKADSTRRQKSAEQAKSA